MFHFDLLTDLGSQSTSPRWQYCDDVSDGGRGAVLVALAVDTTADPVCVLPGNDGCDVYWMRRY